jgi:tetratricopeptide (TPR) repeat protein
MKTTFPIMLIVPYVLFNGCSTAGRNYVEHHDRGYAYFQQNKFERAIKEFSRSLELNPACGAAFFYRGLSYMQLGAYERAIGDLSADIDMMLNSENNEAMEEWEYFRLLAESFVWRGLAYFRLSEHKNALWDLTQSIKCHPINPRAFYFRAHVYYFGGNNHEDAIRDLESAINNYKKTDVELFPLPTNFIEICQGDIQGMRDLHTEEALRLRGIGPEGIGVIPLE